MVSTQRKAGLGFNNLCDWSYSFFFTYHNNDLYFHHRHVTRGSDHAACFLARNPFLLCFSPLYPPSLSLSDEGGVLFLQQPLDWSLPAYLQSVHLSPSLYLSSGLYLTWFTLTRHISIFVSYPVTSSFKQQLFF